MMMKRSDRCFWDPSICVPSEAKPFIAKELGGGNIGDMKVGGKV